MKIYTVAWLDGAVKGQLEAFSNRTKAMTKLRELGADENIMMVDGLEEVDMPISAAGVLLAMNYGSSKVQK